MFKNLLFLAFLAVVSILLSDCASMSGFQDGRTVGEGNGEIGASLSFTRSPNFVDLVDDDTADSIDLNDFAIALPYLEFGGRYGVGDRLDLSGRINTNLNLILGAKYQILGVNDEKFAMSLGAEVGTFVIFPGLWNVSVPLYLSVHPKSNLAFYLTPRYTSQRLTVSGDIGESLNYVGGNTGVLFGEKNKFGLDIGYFRVGTNNSGTVAMPSIGFGWRLALGEGSRGK